MIFSYHGEGYLITRITCETMFTGTALRNRGLCWGYSLLLMVGLCSVSVEGSLAQANSTQEEVERLIELLQNGDVGERRAAAGALGRIGPAAAPAVEALMGALGAEDEAVRCSAAGALESINSNPDFEAPA